MVNILKRMRKLDERLLRIRNGAGAARIPAPTTQIPFITRVHLTHPFGPGTFTNKYHGSRLFWRNHLRRLKFYNPALPISVTHEKVAGNIRTGHVEGSNTTGESKLEGDTGEQIESNAEASLTVFFDNTITAMDKGKSYEDYLPTQTTASTPAASPSAASTSSAAHTATARGSATLDTRGKTADEIWQWFQEVTGAIDVPMSEEDRRRRAELDAHNVQAEVDRQLVKKGLEAIRAHEAMLRKARGDAEKLKSET